MQATASLGARLPLPAPAIRALMTGRHGDEALVSEIQASIQSVSAPVFASRLRMLAEVDAMNELRACPVPVLYLGATEDRLLPKSCVERVTQEPSVRSSFIEAPHLLLQTKPEASAQAIEAFLADLGAQA